jgi:hypothetical protein
MMEVQLSASIQNLTPEDRANLHGRTVRVCLAPRCRCGGRMEFTGQTRRHWENPFIGTVEVWRCTRRRWWNAWRHPFEYMLPERR